MTHRQVRRIVGSTVLGLAWPWGERRPSRLDNNVSNSNAPSATGHRVGQFRRVQRQRRNHRRLRDGRVWFNRNWVCGPADAAHPEWIFAVQWGDVATGS